MLETMTRKGEPMGNTLYEQAVELLRIIRVEQGDYLDGPISLMQRTFRLGYSVARQLVADLEQAGLLSEKDEAGGRWIKT